MSPSVDRNVIVDEEYFLSISSADLVLTSDHEGWLMYNSTSQRFKFWDGAAWKTLAHSPVTGSDLGDGSVTDAKLRDSAALSVIGRSANSSGDPADIATTASSNKVLRETSVAGVRQVAFDQIGSACFAAGAVNTAALADANVTPAKLEGMGGGGPGLMTANVSGNAEWKGPTNYPAYTLFKDAASEVSYPKISGTSFPTSPVDGQKFFHTTHQCSYVYSSTASGWLSENTYEIDAGDAVDTNSGVYLRMYAGSLTATRYSSTVGWKFNFAVKVVGLFIQTGAAQANSCNVDVMDDGAAVTNGTLALAASDTQKYDEQMMSSSIAALSVIGVKVSGTGPLEGPSAVKVRFRRFET